MNNLGIPITNGVIGILMLLAAEVFISLLVLKSEWVRALVCGTPTVLINNGRLLPEAMQRLRVNVNDLLEQIRSKEYPNVSDIAFAVLENNGALSVIPKADVTPPTARDMGRAVTQPLFPVTLIADGNVNLNNLKLAGTHPGYPFKPGQVAADCRPPGGFLCPVDHPGADRLAPARGGRWLMRKWSGWLLVLAIVAIITSGGILTQRYLDRSADELASQLKQVQQAVEHGDWRESEGGFAVLEKGWNRAHEQLGTVHGPHGTG